MARKLTTLKPSTEYSEGNVLEALPPVIKKLNPKPWIMEFMIIDPEALKTGMLPSSVKLNEWTRDNWESFTTPEQAVIRLTRRGNSGSESLLLHWRFSGRQLRLVNTVTGEQMMLDITPKAIVIK